MSQNSCQRKNRPWTHEDDINLLKGFQVFGAKFNMIKMYFVPDRQKKESKRRYCSNNK